MGLFSRVIFIMLKVERKKKRNLYFIYLLILDPSVGLATVCHNDWLTKKTFYIHLQLFCFCLTFLTEEVLMIPSCCCFVIDLFVFNNLVFAP